jgi:hypothetical protein
MFNLTLLPRDSFPFPLFVLSDISQRGISDSERLALSKALYPIASTPHILFEGGSSHNAATVEMIDSSFVSYTFRHTSNLSLWIAEIRLTSRDGDCRYHLCDPRRMDNRG